MALATLSFAVSNLTGVGHTLDSARALNQQASEINGKLQGVADDVDQFSHEVEDCITRQHYQATHLAKLARSLQDKKGTISRYVTERHKVISASMEFQQNVKNVSLFVKLDLWCSSHACMRTCAWYMYMYIYMYIHIHVCTFSLTVTLCIWLQLSASMDKCHTQFISRETGSTVEDTERMLKNLEELKTFIEQAAEVVQSHGKKVLELVIQTTAAAKTKTSSPWQSPKDVRRLNSSDGANTVDRTPKTRRRIISSVDVPGSPKLGRVMMADSSEETSNGNRNGGRGGERPRANSIDLLDSNASDSITSTEDSDGTVVSRSEYPDSPRLLVTPRKTGVKSSLSMPSVAPPNHDQLMIEGVLHQMENRLGRLREIWNQRQRRLRQSQKVVEFREAVPEITEWVEQVGNKFLYRKNSYGRSIEEVRIYMYSCGV